MRQITDSLIVQKSVSLNQNQLPIGEEVVIQLNNSFVSIEIIDEMQDFLLVIIMN